MMPNIMENPTREGFRPEPREPSPIREPIREPFGGAPMRPGGMPVFHKGTEYVPHTGPAMLEKGEKVIPKEQNMSAFDGASDVLGGTEKSKPKKVLKAIHTRKVHGKGGKSSYIHEHHFTHPEHHKMEEHASANQDEMVSHMMDHMGEQNPGEQEADAGQGAPQMPPSAPAGPVGA